MNEILPTSNLNQLSTAINESHCKATSAASTPHRTTLQVRQLST